VGAAVLLPAAAADAKTKAVFMGLPPTAAKKFQDKFLDVNDFFPHGITVHVGDNVKFVPVGFHTADLAPKGGAPVPLVSPTGDKVAGSNDAANQPFWFNGQDQLGFTPSLTQGLFGKKATYNGTKRVNSGAPLADKPKPMTVKFTKKGSFTYFCDIHPGMKGTVKVVGKKANAPTAKADAKVVKSQLKADAKIGASLAKKTPPANTVDVGSAGPKGVEYYGFVPGTVNVPVGTTLNFRMTKGSFEDHTASTGPGNPEDQNDTTSYLNQLSASYQGGPMFDPRAVYPSEAPGSAAASLTPSLHGNGFWNSGALDNSSASQLPASNSVKFGAAGTYTFYCLIHPFMKTTVKVQ
jgi:plastocyanin